MKWQGQSVGICKEHGIVSGAPNGLDSWDMRSGAVVIIDAATTIRASHRNDKIKARAPYEIILNVADFSNYTKSDVCLHAHMSVKLRLSLNKLHSLRETFKLYRATAMSFTDILLHIDG